MTFSVYRTELPPLFAPYCGGLAHPERLEQALAQLESGQLQGLRLLEGGGGNAYQLRWQGGMAPLERLACTLSFPALPELQYRFELPAYQLTMWLMQAQTPSNADDLPGEFWQWLLLGSPPKLSVKPDLS